MYVDIEMFVDALDRRISAHPEATVSQTVDVSFILVDIEFVLDFPDDFLKNVLNGDQAGQASEFVDHDRLVVAPGPEFTQQVIELLAFRHEHRRAQQRPQVQLRCTLQLEQILGQQHADDVVLLVFIHRKTGVRRRNDHFQELFVAPVDVQQVHARHRHHHIICRHVGDADDAFKHGAAVRFDQLIVFGL